MKTVVQKQKPNFETLVKAIKEDKVCLMECTLKSTQEKVAVVCAVNIDEATEEFEMVPFALFLNGNPYELLDPPMTNERNI